ncbi:hypothetical protein J2X76_004772 [Neorhizobium sp. 2083]|uniref:hypothetical protein n=1 Tax=Neorhizobium sp. 2083 TaxID=2817762 RepID=UPI002865062B|nr:hypothetical protein [Neorhizobium sp. 2083]MDR6819580.1 hypothetical protein [Neorhizobium sp. 2083]
MNLQGPARFKVKYTPEEKAITCEKGLPKFSGEMTSKKPKLYIFSRDGVPIYVGATVRSMSSRLATGWTAEGKGGYYGYGFRHEGSAVDLDVWYDSDPVKLREDGKRSGSDIETVEAEVVYLLRHRTGQWPAYQTEIHFYQSNADHRESAERIVDFFEEVRRIR